MGKKKAEVSNMGRSIIKDRFTQTKGNRRTFLHTTELPDSTDWNRLNLMSVTDQSTLDDFLSTAELARTDFIAEKRNITVIDPSTHVGLPGPEKRQEISELHHKYKSKLKIPRRPHWNSTTTAEELDQLERENFLEWRRTLALLRDEQNLVLTPYEKNLEFWRQLWRVVERSDLVVQIVDARNPLLFYCEDLVTYIREISPEKKNLVILNKADFLTETQRTYWQKYFESFKVPVVFWSALDEINKCKKEKCANKCHDTSNTVERNLNDTSICKSDKGESDSEECISSSDEDSIHADSCIDNNNDAAVRHRKDHPFTNEIRITDEELLCTSQVNETKNHAQSEKGTTVNIEFKSDPIILSKESTYTHEDVTSSENAEECEPSTEQENYPSFTHSSHLVNVDDLLDIFRTICSPMRLADGKVATVGMVGYPNVGKSTTINAILQKKKVPVSATPGRTKHFQTLHVADDLVLCDCPGLVFPSFVNTKADLIVNGILPIDQMREHIPPIALICERIPRDILCRIYGILLPLAPDSEDPSSPPTPHELLASYSLMRGYMTHKGLPDGPRSSRYILKDYVNGKLVYCEPPPGIDLDEFQPTAKCVEILQNIHKPLDSGKRDEYKPVRNVQSEVDKEFFTEHRQTVHVVGVSPTASHMQGTLASRPSEKPWKQKDKTSHKKREKLRRVYRHLDEH